MIAGYGICIVMIMIMKWAPLSPLGTALNRQLVELPLQRLARLQRHHLIFVVLIVALLMAGSEAMAALGSVDFAVIYALDVSLYIDGLLMTLALASLARSRSRFAVLRARGSSLATRLRRRFGRRRIRALPPGKRPGKSANDDKPAPAWPLAA